MPQPTSVAFRTKACVQRAVSRLSEKVWVPAFAGKTEGR